MSHQEHVLGIDIGTGSARAGIFTTDGVMLAEAKTPIAMHRPAEHHVEQSSTDIWRAVCSSVRVGHGESYLLITVLACFLAGANPFGGFGRVLPLVLGLMSLQVIASGMNLMGASQHLATAVWGAFLIIVMALRMPFIKQS